MDARQQHPVYVEHRFDPAGVFFLKELPLIVRETFVMVLVVSSDAPPGNVAQRIELLLHGVNHQRRENLLQYIAVLFEHELEEFACIVGDQIYFQTADDALVGQRLVSDFQTQQLFSGQQMNATQIEVAVGRGKTVEVRAADRRKEQRVRVRGHRLAQAWVVGGVVRVHRRVRRARKRKS